MPGIENSSAINGAGVPYDGSQALAQMNAASGKQNFDQALQTVQGRAPNGQTVVGTLLQRTYGTGYVSYFFKGNGAAHPLPTTLTSRADALAYVRAQISKGTWTDLKAADPRAADKTQIAAPGSRSAYIQPVSASTVVTTLMGLPHDFQGSSVNDNVASTTDVFSASPLAQRYATPSTVSLYPRDSAVTVRNTYQDGWDFRQAVQTAAAYMSISEVRPERLMSILKSIGIDATSTEFMRGVAAANADIKSKEPPALLTGIATINNALGSIPAAGVGRSSGGGTVRRPTVTQNRPLPVSKPVVPGGRPVTAKPPTKVPNKTTSTNRTAGVGKPTATAPAATLAAEPLVQLARAQIARKDVDGAQRSIEALKTSETQARQAGNTARADAIGIVRQQLEGERTALLRDLNQPQSAALRSILAAKKAFNNPAHWDTSGKLITPKAGSLSGTSLQRWDRLQAKFPGLADKLFDANVRGGFEAIDAVLRNAKSSKSVTVGDLGDLHILAFDSGATTRGQSTAFDASLHDAVHSIAAYGVSSKQEWGGDLHADFVLNKIFTGADAVKLNPKKSLSEQPLVAAEISTRIDAAYGKLKLKGIVEEITAKQDYFVVPSSATLKPRKNAERVEKILTDCGSLAHLNVADSATIKGMIYGRKNSNSFESIAARNGGGDPAVFKREVEVWAFKLKAQVMRLSRGDLMSPAEFRFRAEKAVALGVLLNRTQPGAMSEGPLYTPLDASMLNTKARNLDLRTTLPAALEDVRKALSAAQK